MFNGFVCSARMCNQIELAIDPWLGKRYNGRVKKKKKRVKEETIGGEERRNREAVSFLIFGLFILVKIFIWF